MKALDFVFLLLIGSHRLTSFVANPEQNQSFENHERMKNASEICKKLYDEYRSHIEQFTPKSGFASSIVDEQQENEQFLNTFIEINDIQNIQKTETVKHAESKEYFAIDVGGTYLKLGIFKKNIKIFEQIASKKTKIPIDEAKDQDMFEWIAKEVKDFLQNENTDMKKKLRASLTFSYPVKQDSLSSGKITKMCKNFNFKPIDGCDPVKSLNDIFKKNGMNVSVDILLNDTTATLMASHHINKNIKVAVVLGTGTNGAYIINDKIINSEWGHYKPKINLEQLDKDEAKLQNNFIPQEIESYIGGISFKKRIQSEFKCNDDEFEEIMKEYYLVTDENKIKPNYLDKYNKIKSIKQTIMRILATLIAAAHVQESENDRIVVGINGSGLEKDADKNMLKETVNWVYKKVLKVHYAQPTLIFTDNASLIGGVYALSMQKIKNAV
ncbi:hypothetical protein EDEG_00794 [Edhazardia aedis USNM 41457]|uniref:Phosphotransferase n=1 Tax=Edhazardia aedis (strain USNM 41457) TaxID=1003232 RepID=J9DCB4_EDHAE|nr:hypothetical protein EDEG_00794 [Edhazardia aedis USNM 41457]|eukprot:EJW05124.1 hypothetical protein EDEG_00794 [Edhazardia aedis USNM 41457]